MKHNKNNQHFYAKAAVGVSILASLVGAGVYLWQRRDSKKELFKKARIRVVNDIKRASRDMSERMKKLSE